MSSTTTPIHVPERGEKLVPGEPTPDHPIVPFIEGDGIGVDITPVMKDVVGPIFLDTRLMLSLPPWPKTRIRLGTKVPCAAPLSVTSMEPELFAGVRLMLSPASVPPTANVPPAWSCTAWIVIERPAMTLVPLSLSLAVACTE